VKCKESRIHQANYDVEYLRIIKRVLRVMYIHARFLFKQPYLVDKCVVSQPSCQIFEISLMLGELSASVYPYSYLDYILC
jgi:hypothetical protein